MTQMKVFLLFIALIVYMVSTISAQPLKESDGAEIVMKIEKINEQLPGVQAKPKENPNDEAKDKKKQRHVYFVNTKVNGKFGKNVRAFTSEEFVEKHPLTY